MASNYPPGETGAISDLRKRRLQCPNMHVWEAVTFRELGGLFFVDDNDANCPECDEEVDVID